jgi:hypothetical protein
VNQGPLPSEPGERGALTLRSGIEPILAAEVRSPNPAIECRFEPPSAVTSLLQKGRLAAAGVQGAFGRAFSLGPTRRP